MRRIKLVTAILALALLLVVHFMAKKLDETPSLVQGAIGRNYYRPPLIRLESNTSSSLAVGGVRGSNATQLWAATAQRTTQQGALSIAIKTGTATTDSRSRLVLLLSSTGRSGSTFVGELLSTMESTVYFYEPLNFIKGKHFTAQKQRVPEFLREIFQCHFDEEFKQWLTKRAFYFKNFNKKTRMLPLEGVERRMFLQTFNMTKECLLSNVRLIKVIRARVRDLGPLLDEESLDLRVIHLFRDPRGYLSSMVEFGSKDNCAGLYDDLLSFPSLAVKYPGKLLQIPYEKVSQNPTKYAKLMFEHAFGSHTLPDLTKAFIDSHTKTNIHDLMSTTKESSTAYQAWRDKISPELLVSIESDKECRKALNQMKYKLFGNIEHVRNKEIPVF